MNSPFLFDFVSNLRLVPSAISMVTLAPSTASPFTSFTTPLTIPVDCAAAGMAIAQATSAMHPISHGTWRLIWRIMEPPKNDRGLVYPFYFAAGRRRPPLLVVQRLDRIQAGGFHRGIDARDEANRHRHRKCQSQRTAADDGGPAGKARDQARHRRADEQPEGAAGRGNQRRLHDELPDDVGAAGANRPADADFPGPLEHAREHDVH